MITTSIAQLKIKSENVNDSEAADIVNKLIDEINLHPTAIGLAAIQIGIPKKVAIVKYNNKIYRLLNTKIIKTESPTVIWKEGCLSLPHKLVNTNRFAKIEIEDDVIGHVIMDMPTDGLLPIIFQHEIDHFEGKTIIDRQLKPIRKEKIGRNDPCPCGSGKKYKKCCLSNDVRRD